LAQVCLSILIRNLSLSKAKGESRYLLWVYETALKEECGYQGDQPYWDWSLDVPENGGAQFNASPIFDPVTGFGGNGANGSVPVTIPPGTTFPTGLTGTPLGSCIDDGPFANKLLVLNPGPPPDGILTAGTGRCLKRNFQPGLVDGALAWNANVELVLNLTAYVNFTRGFDALAGTGIPSGPGIHGGGHIGIGGEVCGYILH
jgi:tyrosinase